MQSTFLNKVHRFIDGSHIYKTKPETWLKFLGLAISWFGGFFWLAPTINITQYSVAFFIYSIALFMEYFSKLISTKMFSAKFYPLLIILCGTALLLDSISQWKNQGIGVLSITFLNVIALSPVVILFIDALCITMVEKSAVATYNVENNLFWR